MKKLIAFAAATATSLVAPIAAAADFGSSPPPPPEAYAEPLPAPIIIDRPNNNYYEENGNYYASPYPLPYFGLFPEYGPGNNFYVNPYWQADWRGRAWSRRGGGPHRRW
jgi:hypothetical protein